MDLGGPRSRLTEGSRRGRGVSVTGTGPQRSVVVAKARELVAVARRYGYRPDELTALIEQVSVELP